MRIILKPAGAVLITGVIGLLAVTVMTQARQRNQPTAPLQTATLSLGGVSTPAEHRGVFVARPDLLINADFEGTFSPIASEPGRPGQIAGRIGEGWFDSSTWAEVEAEYAPDEERPHSGGFSQRITVRRRTTGRIQFAQNIHLTGGRPCRVSLWLRADRSIAVEFGVRSTEDPFPFLGATTKTIGREWGEVQAEVSAPREGTYQLMLYMPSPGTLWADDAIVEEAME